MGHSWRVSKGRSDKEHAGGERLNSLEQKNTYVGEQQKISSLVDGATQMAVNADHLDPLRTKEPLKILDQKNEIMIIVR